MSEFVEFVKEIFQPFGIVTARKMFSGYGLYYDSIMFGLIADEVLYLKVDNTTVPWFEAKGLTPFTYHREDKVVKMSYYLAPEEIYDEPAEAVRWAKLAVEAAYRSKSHTNKTSKISSKLKSQ